MNARLLVLGVLHRGDFHPYEIKRRLERAMVECYIDVDVGTLYYAVRQLEKDGFIEAKAEERVARGGVRTIYRITDKGRAEFRNGLHKQLEIEGPVTQTLYGALLFLHLADPEIAKAAFRRRVARLDDLIEKLKPIRKELGPDLSTGGTQLLNHLDLQRRLDRDWLKALLADIERDGIKDVAQPERLAAPTN
jgi:DNA-binding PadR family transcriptional regulator